jgi:microcystin degradation protein MlrC
MTTDREARARALAEQIERECYQPEGAYDPSNFDADDAVPLILAYEAAIWEQAAQLVEADKWGELGSRFTLRQQLAAALRAKGVTTHDY